MQSLLPAEERLILRLPSQKQQVSDRDFKRLSKQTNTKREKRDGGFFRCREAPHGVARGSHTVTVVPHCRLSCQDVVLAARTTALRLQLQCNICFSFWISYSFNNAIMLRTSYIFIKVVFFHPVSDASSWSIIIMRSRDGHIGPLSTMFLFRCILRVVEVNNNLFRQQHWQCLVGVFLWFDKVRMYHLG